MSKGVWAVDDEVSVLRKSYMGKIEELLREAASCSDQIEIHNKLSKAIALWEQQIAHSLKPTKFRDEIGC